MNKEQFEKNFTEFIENNIKILVDAYKQLENRVETINIELQKKNALLKESLNDNAVITNTLNNILESISNGIIVIDAQGSIIMVNSATCDMLGVSKYDLEGKNYDEVFSYLPQNAKLSNFLNTPEKEAENEKRLNKRGVKIPVLYHHSLLYDHKGEITGATESLTDLSSIKAIEDKFIQHKTLAGLGEMAATVAHEIRNPLGAIGGFVGMLKDCVDESQVNQHKIIDKTLRSISVLNKTVTNLLAFTRGMEISIKNIRADVFFQPIIDIIEENIKNSNADIDLKLELSPFESLILKIDNDKLNQVLVNLLINAIQAIKEKGTVKVGLKMKGLDKILFFVEDSQGTLPKEDIEKIFNPFYTTKENGTGLGLAICNKIVELHRGNFRVEVEENQYTKFVVELPQ